ncbi:MAG: helix-turn-helix domain-containing protein [Clostridium sp.]|nr:helix-turn-helix domain-containing protein [Clostridium sp.]
MEKELDYIALGIRIRQARKEHHVTQEQLGELCELSTAHIGHIERGTRIPSIDTLFRIAQALDVSMDYLIFDSIAPDENLFTTINSILQSKDKRKVKIFMTIVRALADKIDEF